MESNVKSMRPFRATQINTDSFRAWLASGVQIDVSAATTLEEAKNIIAPHSVHKSTFWIEHNRADARRFVHVFGVTKSTKKGYWRESYDGGPRVFEGFCEVKPLGTMQLYAPFEPVAPWQWSEHDRIGLKHGICTDLADVVGRDGGEVVNA